MMKVIVVWSLAMMQVSAAIPDGYWNGKPWQKEKLEEFIAKKDSEALAEWAFWSYSSWGGAVYDAERIFKYAQLSARAKNPYGQAMLARCYVMGLERRNSLKKDWHWHANLQRLDILRGLKTSPTVILPGPEAFRSILRCITSYRSKPLLWDVSRLGKI